MSWDCFDCHKLCSNCLFGPTFDGLDYSFCTCAELQIAHVQKSHNVLLGQPPESLDPLSTLPNPAFFDDLQLSDNGWLDVPSTANGTASGSHAQPHQEGQRVDETEPMVCDAHQVAAPLIDHVPTAQTWSNENLEPEIPCQNDGTADTLASANKAVPEKANQGGPDKTIRRRDYTKDEKDNFLRWIAETPKPTKQQKAEYARDNCLTKKQLQTLINNHRSRTRPVKTEDPSKTKSLSTDAVPMQCDLETLNSLSKKPSYSSIEEYLSAPEDAAVLESVKLVAENVFVQPDNQGPDENDASSSVSSPSTGSVSYILNLCGIAQASLPHYTTQSDRQLRSSGPGSVYSAVSSASTASTAYSFSSARTRVKKGRRERATAKAIAGHGARPAVIHCCSFCEKGFNSQEARNMHEETHPHPQTFPCTFCDLLLDSIDEWKTHEWEFHCDPQQTWFCMLYGFEIGEKCLFCFAHPSQSHYRNAHHIYHRDSWKVHPPAFSTRYDFLRHLINKHRMPEGHDEILNARLDHWSMTVDISHDFGRWACGYCGMIGADWNTRTKHIINHWKKRGPEFIKKHPWDLEKICYVIGRNRTKENMKYFENLCSGKEFSPLLRPSWCEFPRVCFYEAAVMLRGRIQKQDPRMDEGFLPLSVDSAVLGASTDAECQQGARFPRPNSSHPPHKPQNSVFSTLAKRAKTFLAYAKIKRSHKK